MIYSFQNHFHHQGFLKGMLIHWKKRGKESNICFLLMSSYTVYLHTNELPDISMHGIPQRSPIYGEDGITNELLSQSRKVLAFQMTSISAVPFFTENSSCRYHCLGRKTSLKKMHDSSAGALVSDCWSTWFTKNATPQSNARKQTPHLRARTQARHNFRRLQ